MTVDELEAHYEDIITKLEAEKTAVLMALNTLTANTDVGAVVREWLKQDPTWAKTIPADLWEQIAKSRAGFFDK